MKRLGIVICLALVAGLFSTLGTRATVAQDASPAATECASTSVDENIAIVQSLIDAVNANDASAVDEIVSDTATDNVESYGVVDDPTSNVDEIADMNVSEGIFPGSTVDVVNIFGADDKVVVQAKFTVVAHNLTGDTVQLDEPVSVDMVSIYTVECGLVQSQFSVTDGAALLTALGQFGSFEDTRIATPAAS